MSASLSVAGEQSERVCLLRRVFRPTSLDSSSESPVASMYLDMESGNNVQQRERLQSTVPENFAAASRSAKYELDFRSGIDPGNDEHRAYLAQFLDDACTMLLDSLDSAEAALAKEPDPLNDEVKLHLAFAELRARRFSPTASSSTALARAKTCISGKGGGSQSFLCRIAVMLTSNTGSSGQTQQQMVCCYQQGQHCQHADWHCDS